MNQDTQVILVSDDQGNFTGEYISKEAGHNGVGKRHLAITVLLYNNQGQVLLQRRKHKVFDDIWDFGATHPLHLGDKDESFEEATLRCLKREYGINFCKLEKLGSFNYFAKYKNNLCENEHCALLIGEYNDKLSVNPEIAYTHKWVSKEELLYDLNHNQNIYSPWVVSSLPLLISHKFFGDIKLEGEEILNIVNKDNEVISRAKRSRIYEQGLLHRAVNIIVKNSKGGIFLQQRSKNKSSFPLYWDLSCAEHLKPGETFTEAAVRGLKEELGINIDTLELIRPLHHQYSEFQRSDQSIKENELVELYEIVYDHRMKLDKQEVARGKFFPISTIKKMVKSKQVKFTPWFLDEWNFLREYLDD